MRHAQSIIFQRREMIIRPVEFDGESALAGQFVGFGGETKTTVRIEKGFTMIADSILFFSFYSDGSRERFYVND